MITLDQLAHSVSNSRCLADHLPHLADKAENLGQLKGAKALRATAEYCEREWKETVEQLRCFSLVKVCEAVINTSREPLTTTQLVRCLDLPKERHRSLSTTLCTLRRENKIKRTQHQQWVGTTEEETADETS